MACANLDQSFCGHLSHGRFALTFPSRANLPLLESWFGIVWILAIHRTHFGCGSEQRQRENVKRHFWKWTEWSSPPSKWTPFCIPPSNRNALLRPFALFCALLRTCVYAPLRSFPCICVFLQTTAFRTTAPVWELQKTPRLHGTVSKSSRELLPSSVWHESGTHRKLFRKLVQMNFFFFAGRS